VLQTITSSTDIELTVTDCDGLTDTDTFTVTWECVWTQ